MTMTFPWAFPGLINYWLAVFMICAGFYIVIAQGNLVKKIVGLNIFQVSVFVFYISMAKVDGGTAPIFGGGWETFSNPLPHVLILTAIVVGVATTALGLALIVRIRERFGTIEDAEITAAERVFESADAADAAPAPAPALESPAPESPAPAPAPAPGAPAP